LEQPFKHDLMRKDGAIVQANFDQKEMNRLSFFHALVQEVTFPRLDKASKDRALLTVKLQPETTRITTSLGGGKQISAFNENNNKKDWLASNFRLTIDGIDCDSVTRIEPMTFKQELVEHAIGQMRDYQMEPANLELPQLVVTLP